MSTPFLEIITATFAAAEVKTYMVGGGYFEIIDAPYPVTVRLVDRYGTVRGQMNNAESSFYMKQGEFDAIEITSANAQTIRFAYGSSEAGTRRTSGVVSVVDGGGARSKAGDVFGWRLNYGALAGNWNVGQIWNPVGSGKNLIIKSYSTTAASVVGNNNVDLATPNGTIGNKKAGGRLTAMTARGLQQASAIVAGFSILNGISQNLQIVEPEPIVIPPGFGFVMITDNSAIASTFTAHFVEEMI